MVPGMAGSVSSGDLAGSARKIPTSWHRQPIRQLPIPCRPPSRSAGLPPGFLPLMPGWRRNSGKATNRLSRPLPAVLRILTWIKNRMLLSFPRRKRLTGCTGRCKANRYTVRSMAMMAPRRRVSPIPLWTADPRFGF